MQSITIAKNIAQAAHDMKAERLCVLDLRKLTSFTEFFVLANGRSDRQVQAIADHIAEVMKKKKVPAFSIEGQQVGHWILIDFGSVVAHIFYEETRDYYDLDRLWGDAKEVKVKLK